MSDPAVPPNITGTKRKSRFEDASASNSSAPPIATSLSGGDDQPPAKRMATGIDLSAAAAKAAAISREMASKLAASVPATLPTTTNPAVLSALAQAQLRAQLAAQEKKISMLAQIRPLLLDAQGREIDEKGNLIAPTTIAPIKTIAINTNLASSSTTGPSAVHVPPKKKENPYLAHRQVAPADTPATTEVAPVVATTHTEPPAVTAASAAVTSIQPPVVDPTTIVDDRIVLKDRHRASRLKKALHFVEPGTFIAQEEAWKVKENQKMLAGYASGRKQMHRQLLNDPHAHGDKEGDSSDDDDDSDDDDGKIPVYMKEVPPMLPELTPILNVQDDLTAHWYNRDQLDDLLPSLEWWDVCFLPKAQREQRRSSSAQSILSFPQTHKTHQPPKTTEDTTTNDVPPPTASDDFSLLSPHHCKTVSYVQHPPPFLHSQSNLAVNKAPLIVPTYLTKAERKKLRKATRAEREKVKREQQMLGLIPAPEPKFKLSNFMKILGDTAVSDPSKVEKKVVEQIQKRMLNHAMRNLAAKLTPEARKQKKLLRLQQDNLLAPGQHPTGNRLLQTAVYRVTDFECTKYQYKVDVHAQQWLLSGTAVLCHIYKPVKKTPGVSHQDTPTTNQQDTEKKTQGGGEEMIPEMELVDQMNLVVVEGGVKSMRKFEKLMMKRIRWTEFVPAKKPMDPVEDTTGEGGDGDTGDAAAMYPPGYLEALRAKELQEQGQGYQQQQEENQPTDGDGADIPPSSHAGEKEGMEMDGEEEDDDDEDSDSEDEDDEDDDETAGGGSTQQDTRGAGGATAQGDNLHFHHPGNPFGLLVGPIQHRPSAKCELLWQGETAKRLFHGFKFQAVPTLTAAKQYCDQKQIGHFWDMLMQVETKDRAKAKKDKGKKKKQDTTTANEEDAADEKESVGDIFDADFWQ